MDAQSIAKKLTPVQASTCLKGGPTGFMAPSVATAKAMARLGLGRIVPGCKYLVTWTPLGQQVQAILAAQEQSA